MVAVLRCKLHSMQFSTENLFCLLNLKLFTTDQTRKERGTDIFSVLTAREPEGQNDELFMSDILTDFFLDPLTASFLPTSISHNLSTSRYPCALDISDVTIVCHWKTSPVCPCSVNVTKKQSVYRLNPIMINPLWFCRQMLPCVLNHRFIFCFTLYFIALGLQKI